MLDQDHFDNIIYIKSTLFLIWRDSACRIDYVSRYCEQAGLTGAVNRYRE